MINNSKSVADASEAAKQALVQLALISLAGGDVAAADAAALLRILAAKAEAEPGADPGILVQADQIKLRGAGRRPASLVGREVVVTAVWTVVREHQNGEVAVSLVPARSAKAVATGAGRGATAKRKA